MGGMLSVFKHSEPMSVSTAGYITDDPRSPTEGISRTPLAGSRRPYLETDIDNLTPTQPLRVKLLKKGADPRSPSAGINRTPITLMQSSSNFESPVSLYSNYQTDTLSESCLSLPVEPSVNVSDFESEFARELDSLVDQLDISLTDSPATENCVSVDPPKSVLSLKDDTTKKICESLVAEIIESFKEYEDEVKCTKPVPEKKKLKLAAAPTVAPDSLPKLRKRKPLSNITSSAGNTPVRKVHTLRKDDRLVKVELSGENSPIVPSIKVRAQWDNDTTVII